jgi:hypothetical protein
MEISEELVVTAAEEEVKELPIIYFKNIGKSKRKRERERERESGGTRGAGYNSHRRGAGCNSHSRGG